MIIAVRSSIAAFALAAAALGGWASSAHAQVTLFVVDFEEYPEGTDITDQYADLGITFAVQDHPDEAPVIAAQGAPRFAFTGSGTDAPMSSGTRGLTDPLVGGDELVGRNLVMNFDPPITSLRLFAIDIESNEFATLRAFDGKTEVEVMGVVAGDPNTGNGVSSELFVESANITSAVLEVDLVNDTGWAIDFIVMTRPCEGVECGPRLRVSQESAPGLGDFNDNILGDLQAWPITASAAEFYAYGVPEGSSWNGPWLTPVADRSHMLFANTDEGVSMFIVHDRAIPNDPDGGRAEMLVEILNDADGAERTVEDCPSDDYVGEPGDAIFTARQNWDPCCTDGYAISGLDCQSSTFVQFTDVDGNSGNATIDGMTEWVAYSADGTLITLALAEDRRVRIDVIPSDGCPADLNCDGTVNVNDLLDILAAWGQSAVPEDIDESGTVDVNDILLLLSLWGPCV